jgi:TRAP-type C4-dicarboxylate transport system permease small subunit
MHPLLERVVLWWALLGGILLLSIVGVTAFNVAAFAADDLAGLFGGSVEAFPGYEDFVRLVISAAALMLFPYCQLRHGHVAVELWVDRLPRAAKRAIDLVAHAAMAVLVLFLLFWMWIGMLETWADGEVSRVLGWPEWPFYLPGLISLALWAAVAARDAARLLQGAARR